MMEIKFPGQEQNFLRCVCRGNQEQELTHELRLSDGMPDIGRVISAWGQVILRSKEWRRDNISFSGGVMAWVLYIPEDGTQPRSIESWIPFQMKWDMEDSMRDGDIRVQPIVRFADARSISPRKIMLRMGVAAQAEGWLKDSAEVFTPENLPDDTQLLMNTYPVQLHKASGEKAFSLDEVLELSTSQPLPEKLIYYTLQPVIREKKMVGNKLLFRGIGRLHLLFAAQDGSLYSQDFEVPFSQYTEVEEPLSDGASTDIWMGITGLEVEMEQENQLRLKCGLLAQYLLDDRQMISVAEDAYSTSMEVTAETDMLNLPSLLGRKQLTVDTKDALRKDVDNVADTVYLPGLPTQRRDGDLTTWEVSGMFQMLYYDSGHMLQSYTARQLGQVSMMTDLDSEVHVNMLPGEEAAAVPGIDGMEVSGQAVLDVHVIAGKGIPMVTGITVGPKKEGDMARPSLILRRAGDDSLWQIAKDSSSTVSMIQKANGLEGEPERDRMLLIPVV